MQQIKFQISSTKFQINSKKQYVNLKQNPIPLSIVTGSAMSPTCLEFRILVIVIYLLFVFL